MSLCPLLWCLRAFLFPNFLSDAECDFIVNYVSSLESSISASPFLTLIPLHASCLLRSFLCILPIL